jgi:hypothetical protein
MQLPPAARKLYRPDGGAAPVRRARRAQRRLGSAADRRGRSAGGSARPRWWCSGRVPPTGSPTGCSSSTCAASTAIGRCVRRRR